MANRKLPRQPPRFETYVEIARVVLREQGIHALENPHAETGRMCGCGTCFCCAAEYVMSEIQIHAVQGY